MGQDPMPQDPIQALKEGCTTLAQARQAVEDAMAAFDAQVLIVAETPEGKRLAELEAKKAEALKEVIIFDARLRETAIDVVAELGDREPVPGVEVIERTRFVILNQQQAFDWAMDNMKAALKLEERTFQKLVLALPAGDRPKMVYVDKEPSVRIAQDLRMYLSIEEVVGPEQAEKGEGTG